MKTDGEGDWELELFEEKFGRVEFTPTRVSIESLVVEKVKEKPREAKET